MRVFSLTTPIMRTVIAIALAASFHPKLRERAHPEETEGAQDVAEEERPQAQLSRQTIVLKGRPRCSMKYVIAPLQQAM